jgi:hypothetical protein
MKGKIKQDCERRHLMGCRGCPALGLCAQKEKEAKK